jgi:hypothetical protein
MLATLTIALSDIWGDQASNPSRMLCTSPCATVYRKLKRYNIGMG